MTETSHPCQRYLQEDFETEATIRADLAFDYENESICFPKQDYTFDSIYVRGSNSIGSGEEHSTSLIQGLASSLRTSDDTEEVNIEEKEATICKQGPSSHSVQIKIMESEKQLKVAELNGNAEEERKRFEELKKTKPKTTLRKPTSLAQERNQMMNFLKGQGYKNLQKLKYPQMKELSENKNTLIRKRKATIAEEQPSKKPKLRTETIDELRNYLRVVDFEKNAQDRESLEGISMITGSKLLIHPNGSISSFTPEQIITSGLLILYWDILHFLDRQGIISLYRVV
ncbi:hypothetical protein Tco_1030051 [Tanacetum coccineum]|uniref:Uncharacterized protein n=1 Tax=Tanacetum coccineum TaxID=301880 RepID=A0ABQ5G5I7_9ASTR